MPAPAVACPPYRSPVRLRRLRSGTLSAVRLRRRHDNCWPHTGLRDRDPPPRPEPVTDCPGPPACGLDAPHRHLDLPPAIAVRPHPAANAWPDDAVTVTYAELRRLVALHLELCASTMPKDSPWDWMRMRARALRDGETPLLLAEVMEP
jgi:hypothetical protein